jgi:hypothetical protein
MFNVPEAPETAAFDLPRPTDVEDSIAATLRRQETYMINDYELSESGSSDY